MRILIHGPQGSGKSSVGKALADHLKIPFIGAGLVFRHVSEKSRFYEILHTYMSQGELVPNSIAGRIFENAVHHIAPNNTYVLDSWMRDMEQLKHFDPDPTHVVVLNISRDTSKKRILGRRICESTGEMYNIYYNTPEELAECKGELIQRDDDTEEALDKRLDIYYNDTMQVIEYYKKQGIVTQVDAEPPLQEVIESTIKIFR